MSTPRASDTKTAQVTKDELELQLNGHKQELPRRFSRLAALSFAFSICNSWVGECATFTAAMNWGGGPAVVFSILVGTLACGLMCVGLAELASAYPTSGGQYHFAFMVSSNEWKAFTAFVTGWVSLAAWCLISAASAIYAAEIIAQLAAIYHADYTPTSWQIYLIYIVILVLCALVICLLPKQLPRLEQGLFFASISAVVVFFISVLAASDKKQPASTVFVDYNNQSGWPDGLSFLLSSGTAMYLFIGIDAVIHLTEEIPDPSKHVPQVLGLTLLIGFVTVFPWTIAFLFSVDDYVAVVTASQPVFSIFYESMRNESVATFYLTWYLVIYWGATMSSVATTGRQAWAFARDNGTPCAKWMAMVHPSLEMPVNATIAVTVVTCVYGALYCGSTSAFNSFLNTAILFINVSYTIPQAVVLYRGRHILPERHFDAGRFGAFCNAFSALWMLLYTVVFSFPTTSSPSVNDMNYVSPVVVVIIAIIASIWYGGKRKTFVGPIIIEELSGFSVEEATDNGPGDGLDDRWKTKNETLSGKEISKHS